MCVCVCVCVCVYTSCIELRNVHLSNTACQQKCGALGVSPIPLPLQMETNDPQRWQGSWHCPRPYLYSFYGTADGNLDNGTPCLQPLYHHQCCKSRNCNTVRSQCALPKLPENASLPSTVGGALCDLVMNGLLGVSHPHLVQALLPHVKKMDPPTYQV